MALQHPQTMTVEEYFQLEEDDSENRYEYVDGHVYLMAGGTFDHNTICGNIYSILRDLLRGKPCRVYNSDIKVQISQQRYFHPDITVTCDPRDRGTGDLLKSPRVIFEVLSPGTEIKDRTWKLQNYLALPSMEEYILVDAKSPRMETYRRENGRWMYDIYHAHETIELPGIGVRFPLADAYIDIEFEQTALDSQNDP
ncbi:MAG TPA: Uma2 family endonuclease [Ktedonobacteraceae bacterium]|nr:Uma2 family endonuclease [Ktedonobacteraceae bacterium]